MKFLLVSIIWIVPFFTQDRPLYLLAPNDQLLIRTPQDGPLNGRISA